MQNTTVQYTVEQPAREKQLSRCFLSKTKNAYRNLERLYLPNRERFGPKMMGFGRHHLPLQNSEEDYMVQP